MLVFTADVVVRVVAFDGRLTVASVLTDVERDVDVLVRTAVFDELFVVVAGLTDVEREVVTVAGLFVVVDVLGATVVDLLVVVDTLGATVADLFVVVCVVTLVVLRSVGTVGRAGNVVGLCVVEVETFDDVEVGRRDVDVVADGRRASFGASTVCVRSAPSLSTLLFGLVLKLPGLRSLFVGRAST